MRFDAVFKLEDSEVSTTASQYLGGGNRGVSERQENAFHSFLFLFIYLFITYLRSIADLYLAYPLWQATDLLPRLNRTIMLVRTPPKRGWTDPTLFASEYK